MLRARARQLVITVLVGAAWLRTARTEAAERVVVGLEYDRATTLLDVCPAEPSFRNLVVARLGYDPFAEAGTAAGDTVRITLALKQGQVHAAASLRRAGKPPPAPRTLDGAPTECEGLVAALATTVAIALDPVHAASPVRTTTEEPPAPLAPEEGPAPAVERSPPGDSSPAREPVVAPPPADRFVLFISAAPVVSGWLMPSISVGGEAGLGLRRGSFSLEVTGRAETMPAAVRGNTADRLTASVFTASLVPCGAIAHARLCGVFRAGEFEGEDVDLPTSGSHSVYAAVGLRAGYSLRLSDAIALEPALEADVPLTQTILSIDARTTVLWTAPVASASFAIPLVASF